MAQVLASPLHPEPPRRTALDRGGRGGLGALTTTRNRGARYSGMEPGTGPDAIAEAHGRLIQRLDPERGGSGHLTKLVDRAKDVLLA